MLTLNAFPPVPAQDFVTLGERNGDLVHVPVDSHDARENKVILWNDFVKNFFFLNSPPYIEQSVVPKFIGNANLVWADWAL